jgi:hypothetical protein
MAGIKQQWGGQFTFTPVGAASIPFDQPEELARVQLDTPAPMTITLDQPTNNLGVMGGQSTQPDVGSLACFLTWGGPDAVRHFAEIDWRTGQTIRLNASFCSVVCVLPSAGFAVQPTVAGNNKPVSVSASIVLGHSAQVAPPVLRTVYFNPSIAVLGTSTVYVPPRAVEWINLMNTAAAAQFAETRTQRFTLADLATSVAEDQFVGGIAQQAQYFQWRPVPNRARACRYSNAGTVTHLNAQNVYRLAL